MRIAVSARRIAELTPKDRRLALEGAFELVRASVELRLQSSRVVKVLEDAGSTSGGDLGARPIDEAMRVGQLVDRVADRLPWHPGCLRRSLAVWRMLTRRGIASEIHLGVTDPRSLEAHSWVTVGEVAVVGDGGLERYVRLASFG